MTETRIPLVDTRAGLRSIRRDVDEAIDAVVSSGRFVMGPALEAFEEEFASACGGAHAVGVGSGTDALTLGLLAAGVGPGDEVVTTANTFTATVMAIRRAGARPVLVDHDPDTYLVDPEAVRAALGPRTAAIVPVHLYGQPAPMDEILALARSAGIAVLQDACQAHGATDGGRGLGGLGTAAAYSFYPGKNLGALGDGGAVVTSDEALAGRLRLLRDFGQSEKYRHEVVGTNSRLDELQAAVLRVKLRRLDAWNEARRSLADRYAKNLAGTAAVTPVTRAGAEHVWHLYVLRVAERDRVRAALAARGIETGIHYPVPIHLQPAHADLGYGRGAFPVAESQAGELLSLPMYPELPPDDLDRVCEALVGELP